MKKTGQTCFAGNTHVFGILVTRLTLAATNQQPISLVKSLVKGQPEGILESSAVYKLPVYISVRVDE
jgi:hypothetical protein